MKKYTVPKITIYILFLMIFSSCQYGVQEAFGREDEVNQRSSSVKNLNGTELAPDFSEEKFSVLFVTDVHFGKGERQEEKFFKKLAEIKTNEEEFPMKFAVCAGDCVESGLYENYEDYQKFCQNLKDEFQLQIYSIPGNHDLYNSGYSFWKDMVYPNTPSYTFSTGKGTNLISWYFLDSGNGTLGHNQLESFEQIAFDDPNPKIVITHYPIYAGGGFCFPMQNKTERNKLISIFAKTNTIIVLSGHSHRNKDYEYEGYFSEHITASYLDRRTFAVLYVDTKEGSCRYERFEY